MKKILVFMLSLAGSQVAFAQQGFGARKEVKMLSKGLFKPFEEHSFRGADTLFMFSDEKSALSLHKKSFSTDRFQRQVEGFAYVPHDLLYRPEKDLVKVIFVIHGLEKVKSRIDASMVKNAF